MMKKFTINLIGYIALLNAVSVLSNIVAHRPVQFDWVLGLVSPILCALVSTIMASRSKTAK